MSDASELDMAILNAKEVLRDIERFGYHPSADGTHGILARCLLSQTAKLEAAEKELEGLKRKKVAGWRCPCSHCDAWQSDWNTVVSERDALKAEVEKLRKQVGDSRIYAQNKEAKLTAAEERVAGMVEALAEARGLLADDYFENWELAHDVCHEAICKLSTPATQSILERREAERAVMTNTPASIKQHRIDWNNRYFSASCQDICDAIDRERREAEMAVIGAAKRVSDSLYVNKSLNDNTCLLDDSTADELSQALARLAAVGKEKG